MTVCMMNLSQRKETTGRPMPIVAQVRARWDELKRDGRLRTSEIVLQLAADFYYDPSYIRRLVRQADVDGNPSAERRADRWDDAEIKRAIRAGVDRFGRPPSSADWSPSLLRQRSDQG
jgi:hypothetical protein